MELQTTLTALTFVSVLIGILVVVIRVGRRSQVYDDDHADIGILKQNQERIQTTLSQMGSNIQQICNDVNSLKTNGSEPVKELSKSVLELKNKPSTCPYHFDTEQTITRIDERQQEVTRRVEKLEAQ